jgi:hypothetical protein
MNTNTTLRDLLGKKPFVPLRIEMVDGHVIRIPHPEFVAMPPQSTDRHNPYFYVWRKDGSAAHINPLLVARMVPESRKRLARS